MFAGSPDWKAQRRDVRSNWLAPGPELEPGTYGSVAYLRSNGREAMRTSITISAWGA